MKKTALAFLAAALLSTGLVGCSSNQSASSGQTSSNQSNDKSSLALNNGGTSKTGGQTSATTPDPKEDPTHVKAVQDELRSAFDIDNGLRAFTPLVITQVASGSPQLQMKLDQKHRLDLAKEISTAISDIGYQPNDEPPDVFLAQDGTAFSIGLKRANADLLLNTYIVNDDGSWKLLKKETKPGKKDSK